MPIKYRRIILSILNDFKRIVGMQIYHHGWDNWDILELIDDVHEKLKALILRNLENPTYCGLTKIYKWQINWDYHSPTLIKNEQKLCRHIIIWITVW